MAAKTKPSISMGQGRAKPVDPAFAEAFTARDDAPPAPERPLALAPPEPKRRSTIERKRDGAVLRKRTIYLEESLAKRLAVYCAKADRDVSEVVGAAVRAYLEGKG